MNSPIKALLTGLCLCGLSVAGILGCGEAPVHVQPPEALVADTEAEAPGSPGVHTQAVLPIRLETEEEREAGIENNASTVSLTWTLQNDDSTAVLRELTVDQIVEVVETRTRAISSCYQRELQRSPNLSGKIVIGWEIDREGKVSQATVHSSTLKTGRTGDCVVRQVNTMKFPSRKSAGSASVTFPFVFTQSETSVN